MILLSKCVPFQWNVCLLVCVPFREHVCSLDASVLIDDFSTLARLIMLRLRLSLFDGCKQQKTNWD